MRSTKLVLALLSLSVLTLGYSEKDNTENNKQEKFNPVEKEITLDTETATIYGSLKLPKERGQYPIVLLIAGSGPTDRDGNNPMGLNTDSYKMISDTLAMHEIASLRYDKRGIAKSYYTGFSESDLTFDDYVTDAIKWIKKLKSDSRFTDIFVLGHSEGALIGSIVTNQTSIDGFISVAGTAQRADSLILEQLSTQPDYIRMEAQAIIDSLNTGILVSNVSHTLYSLFRPSVQPYMISWFQYSPEREISKVTSPVLILHGSNDLQVKSSEAQSLAKNNPDAEIEIIDNMNHVLKNSGSDGQENMATYSNPHLPLSDRFCEMLIDFIEKTIGE